MKNIIRKMGAVLLAVALVLTIFPALPSQKASAATVSNPRVSNGEATWDCVWFGSYPQTEIVGSANQCGTYGKDFESDTDYEVDSALYSQLQNASFNSNGDTTINGTKYRRMLYGDATRGDRYHYVYYTWSDSTTYHYFRYEKIKWRVLNVDGDNAFLLADKGLDDQRNNEKKVEAITWEKCTLRSWLNGYGSSYNTYGKDYSSDNFMDVAFSSSEQSAIYNTSLENSDNIYWGTEGGNSTVDKVFLLSESDVWNTDRAVSYGFVKEYDAYAKQRQAKSSTYAKAMGVWSNPDQNYEVGNCQWWLRSPSNCSSYLTHVDDRGDVFMYGTILDDSCNAVRPALHLNLQSSNWNYAGTVCSDGTVSSVKMSQSISVGSSSYSKTVGASSFNLGAKAQTSLSYSSSNSAVATVSSTGVVTVKGAGTAQITIKASASDAYNAASKTVTINVTKPTAQPTAQTNSNGTTNSKTTSSTTVTTEKKTKSTVDTTKKSQKITNVSNKTKTYGAKSYTLKPKAKTHITYSSSNKNVVKVSSKGKVTIVNPGTAKIKMTAKGTKKYKKATKTITVKIKLKKPTMKTAKLSGAKYKVSWSKVPGRTKYELYYKSNGTGKYKKVYTGTKNSLKLQINADVSMKVRAYRVVKGKKVYSSYSKVKKVNP